MNIAKFLTNNAQRVATRLKSADQLLKFAFIFGTVAFILCMFLFKFELLSVLSTQEVLRLESVKSLRTLVDAPTDPLQGILQWLSLKALPTHEIIALRLPSALMLASSVGFIGASLYIKYRNRYLPYTYLLLSATSPWLILLAHQGSLPGIDLLFFSSGILLSFMAITATNLRQRRKKILFILACTFASGISLQPLGIPLAIIALTLLFKSSEFRYQLINFGKFVPTISYSFAFAILILNGLLSYHNRDFLMLTSGIESFKDPLEVLKSFFETTKSIFGVNGVQSIGTGTGRPDFLLIGAVALICYEAIRRMRARFFILIGFLASLIIAGLYGGNNAIVLCAIFVPTFVSIALSNMVRIIDVAFPVNPYPRNLAKVVILVLITSIAALGAYTFNTTTVRQNTPQKINLYYQKN